MSDFKLVPINKLHAEALRSDKSVLLLTEGVSEPGDIAEISEAIGAAIAADPTTAGVVTLTGDQTIGGNKTFSGNTTVNGDFFNDFASLGSVEVNVISCRPDGEFFAYGTYTDSSNYERLSIKCDDNGANLVHEAAGTGVQRPVKVSGVDPTTPVIAESTTARTLSASDLWGYVRYTNASGCAITLPSGLGSGVESIMGRRATGAGPLSLTLGSGVVVNDSAIASVAAGQTFALKRVGVDTWDFI